MSLLSKHFMEIVHNKTCREIIHPTNPSCTNAFIKLSKKIIQDNFKLFFPIVFVPLAVNYKNGDKEEIIKSLVTYIRIVTNAYISCCVAVAMICLLYQLIGFHKYTFALIPGFCGAGIVFSNCLSQPLARIHAQIFFNMTLEVLIRGSDNPIIRQMRKSKLYGTLIFMITSSMTMYILRLGYTSLFWFIQPTTINKINSTEYDISVISPVMDKIVKTKKQICSHKNSCDNHIMKGILTYGKYGLGLDMVRRIFSNIYLIKKSPGLFLKNIFQNTNYKFLKFLMVYAGLYRLMNCLCNRYFQEDTVKGSVISSLFGSMSYYFCPNYSFFTLPISTAIEASWKSYMASECIKPDIIKKIDSLPISSILYTLTGGLMLHVSLLHPNILPKFARKLVNSLSGNLYTEVNARLNNIIIMKNLN